MSGLFRRALATLVALSFLLAQGGNSAAEPPAVHVAYGFSVPAELTAAANGWMLTELLARIGPPRAVLAASAPQRVPVKEPPRVRPSPPTLSSLRPKLHPAVRPLNGRHAAGWPMLRPVEIDRALKAAAHRRAPASTFTVPTTVPTGGTARRVTRPGVQLAQPGSRRAQSLPSDANASGTGINPWWRYQEESVPGAGRVMVNVGTGNLLFQDDDMNVPHPGIALAFRRTYNSQSGHDVNASDASGFAWKPPGMYGNGWTNTFDAHLARNTDSSVYSVFDIDGARYDYDASFPAGSDGVYTPRAGNHASLVFDGNCGFLWTKKSGTTYYFYRPGPHAPCPDTGGSTEGYTGRLYQIIGRNRNSYLTLNYSWDGGVSSLTGKISQITVQADTGAVATLSFADVNGHRLLQQLTLPDGVTTVSYGYDSLGNLTTVSRPPNNAAGVRPQVGFGYQAIGSTSVLQWVASPRWMACAGGCGYDGGYLYFLFSGSSAAASTLNSIYHGAVVNPPIADGTNTPLQPGYVPQAANYSNYLIDYYTTGVTTPTFRDTDGHMTNWVVDGGGRPTQTQACTASVSQGQQCTATWLVTNESWDAANNLVATTDARGYQTDYAYDNNGNTIAVGEPQVTTSEGTFQPTKLFDYDAFNNVVEYCDEHQTHLAGADWTGTPASQQCASRAAGVPHARFGFTYPSYQNYGQLASMTTPMGYTHRLTYAAAQQGGTDYGLPTAVSGDPITQIDGTTITPTQTFWYGSYGNLRCYSKGVGTWTLQYDALSRLTSVADPDDTSANGTSLCGKTSGQPGWNTQTTYTYNPDGSKQSAQTPAERAYGVSTTSTYDLDGNLASETAHHGCVPNQACPAGTTQKWYDGADRLVEVMLPHDPRSYSDPPTTPAVPYDGAQWVTRYLYDLSGGNTVSVTGSSPFRAYGNLYKTQKGVASAWMDLSGTQFDALDREVAKYSWTMTEETGAGGALETTQLVYDGGPSSALGLLVQKINPRGESVSYAYDALGRVLNQTYAGEGGVTPAETTVYDAKGRAASVTSAQFGAQQFSYDNDGRLISTTEPSGGGVSSPAQISYGYYADGRRSGLSVNSAALNQANAITYSYRVDGLLRTQSVNVYAPGTWTKTYTDAGRPSAVSGADSQSRTYDTTGQLQNYTIGTQTLTIAHDGEGSPSTETIPNVNGSGYAQTMINTYNVRGELVDSFGGPGYHNRATTFGGCMFRQSIPSDGSYQPGTVPTAPTVDGRSCVQTANGSMGGVDYGGASYPVGTTNTFTFDVAGRAVQSRSILSSFVQTEPNPNRPNPGSSGIAQTTRTTTVTGFDAENHTISRHASMVRTRTNADTGTVTTTSADGGTTTLGWGLNGHPILMTPAPGSVQPQPITLHWDGDVVLFVTDGNSSNGVVDFKIGLDGEITPRDTTWNGLTAYDRDIAGVLISGTTISGSGPVCPLDSSDGGPTDVNVSPCYNRSGSAVAVYVRPDGFTLAGVQINGVRAFDPALQSWTTPDAFEGDVHDPASQQKYMWNRGNPVDYSDPSGYSPPAAAAGVVVLGGITALDVAAGLLGAAGAYAASEMLKEHSAALKRTAADMIRNSGSIDIENPDIGGTPNEYGTVGRPAVGAGGPGAGKRFGGTTREGAYDAAGGRCVYCGGKTQRGGKGSDAAETDHGKAKSKGGNNTPGNANNSCRTCNRKKGAKDLPAAS